MPPLTVPLRRLSSYEANFIPIIPATINPRLISFKTLNASPNNSTLAIAVPTAPIPTQTPYARLRGKILKDQAKSVILKTRNNIVTIEASGLLKPSVYFKPTAQAISLSPARRRINQAIYFT
jgi:hypothetical protein